MPVLYDFVSSVFYLSYMKYSEKKAMFQVMQLILWLRKSVGLLVNGEST